MDPITAQPQWTRADASCLDVFRSSSDPVVTIDRAGTIIHCNVELEKLLNASPGELDGASLAGLTVYDPDPGQLIARLATASSVGAVMQLRLRRLDGRAIDTIVSPFQRQDCARYFATLTVLPLDRSPGLLLADEHVARLFESSSVALMACSLHGVLLARNAAFATMFDGDATDFHVGADLRHLLRRATPSTDTLVGHLVRSRRWSGELLFPGRDDEQRHLTVTLDLATGDEAGPVVFASIIDITPSVREREARALSDGRLRRATDLVHLGAWELLPDGTITCCDITYDILGRERRDRISVDDLLSFVHPDDRSDVEYALARTAGSGEQFDVHHRILRPDGQVRFLHVVGEPIGGSSGATPHVHGMVHDVTDVVEHHRRLTIVERRSQAVLDAMSAACAVVDADGDVIAANSAWHRLERDADVVSPDLDVATGQTTALPSGSRSAVDDETRAVLESVLSGRAASAAVDYCRRAHDGVERWMLMQVDAIDPAHGGAVVAHLDITDRKRAELALEYQAQHDALTGLPNRAGMIASLDASIERSSSAGGMVAVLLLDLDRLKIVNDSLGHGAGDVLLTEIAHRLQEVVRSNDVVGRLGGDEFLVLAHVTDGDGVGEVADRMLRAVRKPIEIDGRLVRVGASIGVAFAGSGAAADSDELMRNADTAMYEAKRLGGDKATYFDADFGTRLARRMELEHDLHIALDHGGLALHYQPQFDLRDGKLVAFEALARWPHPSRGWIPPSEFITVAEESRLIDRVGRWALDAACAQLAEWRRLGGSPSMRVAVNLSARQLLEPTIADAVSTALERHRVPASCLELEITETAIVGPLDSCMDSLNALASSGVRLSLDDFGTGNASLHHVVVLPLAAVKVDRSFVARLGGPANEGQSIVSGINAMASALGLDVVAEGIETDLELTALRELDVGIGQGFLLGRPRPANRHDHLVVSGRR